jgi:hypothetical protein
MGKCSGEVEVWLKAPSVEGLKFVEESSGNSAGNIRESRFVDSIRGEENAEKD